MIRSPSTEYGTHITSGVKILIYSQITLLLYQIGTFIILIMLVISSKEFRDNQASYFDRADNGEEIIVQRGKNKSYKITVVSDNDTIIKSDYILAPDAELAKGITAEELLTGIEHDIRELFRKRLSNQ